MKAMPSLSLGTSGVIFGSTKKFLKNYDDAIHSFVILCQILGI
jgi:sugar (pentulose or hexulose) kinase